MKYCAFLPMMLLVAGCGSGLDVELVEVTGKVYDGVDPVVGALVTFQPASGRESYAKTRDDGAFVMMYKVGKPGVIPGQHEVIIRPKGRTSPMTGAAVEEDGGDSDVAPPPPKVDGGASQSGDERALPDKIVAATVTISADDPPEPFEFDLEILVP